MEVSAAMEQRGLERKEPDAAFDLPDDVFRQRYRLKKETVWLLCDELAEELGDARTTTLSVEQQVLRALRFFATGSCQVSSVESDDPTGVTQPTDSKTRRPSRKPSVGAVPFPASSDVDASLIAIIAPKGDRKTWFMSPEGYYALNVMFICDSDMRILAVDPLRPGSDYDARVWRTNWLRRRFQEGCIAEAGEYLLGDSNYPLEPWLLTPIPGHPPAHSAEGRYNAAHAATWTVVERCIRLLKSRFRCLQQCHPLHYDPESAANVVAACTVLHNLCLDEGDSTFDDDCSNGAADSSSVPHPLGIPRRWSSLATYHRGQAFRDGVVGLFGTTRMQHQLFVRRIRRRLRRQQS
ncbi:putative nuclease HARBI1 [Rhipicephalus sanguineus]|uniref:putative nuclease HARBI1 n=1 Tax=Rhipicephalus sanguineus TaxID=34632 RepID=UPI0018951A49|nr:putative nuclease HARBI1 [Rhipicephalus sanguineus]